MNAFQQLQSLQDKLTIWLSTPDDQITYQYIGKENHSLNTEGMSYDQICLNSGVWEYTPAHYTNSLGLRNVPPKNTLEDPEQFAIDYYKKNANAVLFGDKGLHPMSFAFPIPYGGIANDDRSDYKTVMEKCKVLNHPVRKYLIENNMFFTENKYCFKAREYGTGKIIMFFYHNDSLDEVKKYKLLKNHHTTCSI